jgi:hypothetical protein
MGKKPVVGLIGLVWVGMALTGCDCCRNRNKYNTPTFPPTNNTRTTSADKGAPGGPQGNLTSGGPTNTAGGPGSPSNGFGGGIQQPPPRPGDMPGGAPVGPGAMGPGGAQDNINRTGAAMPAGPGAPDRSQSLLQRDSSADFNRTTSPGVRDSEGSFSNPNLARPAEAGLRVPTPPVRNTGDTPDNMGRPMAGGGAPCLPRGDDPPMPQGKPLPSIPEGSAGAGSGSPPPPSPTPGPGAGAPDNPPSWPPPMPKP